MKLINFFVVVVLLGQQAFSATFVTVYEHANYKGGAVVLEDLDLYSYIYFTAFDDVTTSFKINIGSCVEIHKNTPPSYGPDEWFWTSTLDYPNVGREFNDQISSVKSCGKFATNVHCPEGTFVKKVTWDNSGSLTNGIELHCYHPQSLTSDVTLRTHGSEELGGKSECTGIRGVRYIWDERRVANVGMEPLCKQEDSGEHIEACGPREAVTGMEVEIENRSGFIKSSKIQCSNVGNIERICAAHDKSSVLFTCDASTALFPLKCTWSKTIGYGYSTTMSEEQRTERVFHEEFGFEMGAAGYGLSANFKYNVSVSNVTGYSWETTQDSTFQEQTTMTVEVETPPNCVTQVVEIIGECSFIQVRPSHFKRQDTCNNVTFVTDVVISRIGISKGAFLSKVPDKVLKYLKNMINLR